MLTVVRNSGEQLVHTFYVDGVSTPADGAVTIGITKADGTALVAAGTATTHGTLGAYSYILAPQASLNLLTATWTGAFGGVVMSQQDQIELVGNVYVSLSELATMDGLSTTPVATLAKWRRVFEEKAESYCGVAFVPRYARQTAVGNGLTSILLPTIGNVTPRLRTLLSASAVDTAGVATPFTLTNWRFTDYGQITSDGDVFTRSVNGERNLIFEHEHGLDAPPFDIAQACSEFVAAKVLQSTNRHARDLLSETNPSGISQHWSTPDPDAGRPTGLLDCDAALNNYGRRAPAVA